MGFLQRIIRLIDQAQIGFETELSLEAENGIQLTEQDSDRLKFLIAGHRSGMRSSLTGLCSLDLTVDCSSLKGAELFVSGQLLERLVTTHYEIPPCRLSNAVWVTPKLIKI
jgi:hypothetical protein